MTKAREWIRITVKVQFNAGDFAVHQVPFRDCYDPHCWRVSHAPTGCGCGDFVENARAQEYATFLARQRKFRGIRSVSAFNATSARFPQWVAKLQAKRAELGGR